MKDSTKELLWLIILPMIWFVFAVGTPSEFVITYILGCINFELIKLNSKKEKKA